MQIRLGTSNDAEAIAALIASFQSELTDERDGSGAEHFLASVSRHAELGYLESPRYTFIVAERDDTMLGFIALRDVSHVFHLFVAREHQCAGVARRLWQEAKSLALQTRAIRQFTVNASLGAVATYRAFGFRPVGEVVSMHGISFLPMRLDVTGNQPEPSSQ